MTSTYLSNYSLPIYMNTYSFFLISELNSDANVFSTRAFLCTQKVSTLIESVSMSVRPSVYTITRHSHIRLCWNFVHRMVSAISRSSSKMRMIREEMDELSKKLSLLTEPSLRGGGTGFFQKQIFSGLFKTYMNQLSF